MTVSKSSVIMKYRFLQLFFSVILFISATLEAKPMVTVWIRAFGEQTGKQISPYLTDLYRDLSSDFDLDFILCTNQNDPLLAYLEDIKTLPLTIIFADMRSFSQPLNQLIEQTPPNGAVLSLSVGISMKSFLLSEALDWMEKGAWVYGWEVADFGNDGSEPGKGWYNTAALYSPTCVAWMKHNPFPGWIDNGAEGELFIDQQPIPIGGNEEVVLMGKVIQAYPTAFFVLNTEKVLASPSKTGTGISYQAKMKRKTAVAQYYLEHKLHLTPEQLWQHLLIIKS